MKRPRKQSEWKEVVRTEAFSVYQSRSQARRFRINWNDRGGVRRRYRLWADSVEEAAARARNLVVGGGPEGAEQDSSSDPNGLLVIDAFDQALAATRRNERSRRDWKRSQTRFLAWLAKHHPEANYWRRVTRRMVREYIAQTLPTASTNHKRLTLQPVTQTARYMWLEHEVPNIAERLGIGCKLKKTPPLVLVCDVVALLEHVRENAPLLEAGVALQSLAGLQLQEALRLSWDKVNLDRGLIEISGEVKNAYRNRVIPVVEPVLDALKRADQRRRQAKVQVLGSAAVVASPTGCYFDWKNYSHAAKAAIVKWNPKVGWAPKDLRNALPTFFAMAGVSCDLTEQYIGHAPRSVTGRHYVPRLTAATGGEEELLALQMAQFKKVVTGPVEQELGKMARKGHDRGEERREAQVL